MVTNRRLPAEWEKHEATLVAWPHNREDWPGKFVPIHWVYGEIVRQITRFEKALIVVESLQQKKNVSKILEKCHADILNVDFIIRKTDRSWMRDSAPAIVLTENGREAINFKFNGWAKYDNWESDALLPAAVAEKIGVKAVSADYKSSKVVLEGGAIDINGSGTLITTEECLMHDSVQVRNRGFTKADYSAVFREFLGITNVIWLGDGIAGDDTHGHVDDLCRFVNRDTVVLCREKNKNDENYSRLEENLDRLKGARIENGSRLNVVELPMPEPLVFEDMRLPASYANFMITNGSVLVPTFNDVSDRTALGILAELFPTRKVIGIHAVDLVWGLGTLHCLSHEIPSL